MKPPNIVLLTPNGRFEVGTKICLSISAHHPESWQPSWSIRTVLVALIGFLPTKDNGIEICLVVHTSGFCFVIFAESSSDFFFIPRYWGA